jgi:hypothetical protein
MSPMIPVLLMCVHINVCLKIPEGKEPLRKRTTREAPRANPTPGWDREGSSRGTCRRGAEGAPQSEGSTYARGSGALRRPGGNRSAGPHPTSELKKSLKFRPLYFINSWEVHWVTFHNILDCQCIIKIIFYSWWWIESLRNIEFVLISVQFCGTSPPYLLSLHSIFEHNPPSSVITKLLNLIGSNLN